jgi:hypothetical protein
MGTQSAIKDLKDYEKLIRAVSEGLTAADNSTGLTKPFELKIDDKVVELTRENIEKICDTEKLAKQYGDLLKQNVNNKGELGKLNDFNVFLTVNSVSAALELAMNNAFTLTPARVFCHGQTYVNNLLNKKILYEDFVIYVNNMAADGKHPNPV